MLTRGHAVYLTPPIIHLALLVAWMWSFPLFGSLQEAVPVLLPVAEPFGLAFLGGSVLGYGLFGFNFNQRLSEGLLRWGLPGLSVIMVSLVFLTPGAVVLIPVLGLLMGVLLAPALAAGVTRFVHRPPVRIGRELGMMMLLASVIAVILHGLHQFSVGVTYGVVTLMPLLAWWFGSRGHLTDEGELSLDGEHPQMGDERRFWAVFTLVLFSCYYLSWMAHQMVFPVTREMSGSVAGLGLLVYGLVAYGVGRSLDRFGEPEALAMVALSLLISTYMFATVNQVGHWVGVLALGLEASFGALDLFVVAYLVLMSRFLRHEPRSTVALGLALNAGIVMVGTLWRPLTPTPVLLMVAAALMTGLVAAMALRSQRLPLQTRHEEIRDAESYARQVMTEHPLMGSFTNRESDVVELLLQGWDNQRIADHLKITRNTLKTHIRNIYAKSHASSRDDFLHKMEQLEDIPRPLV